MRAQLTELDRTIIRVKNLNVENFLKPLHSQDSELNPRLVINLKETPIISSKLKEF
jgi:hypothetical protein